MRSKREVLCVPDETDKESLISGKSKKYAQMKYLKLARPCVPCTKEYESPKACTNLISSQSSVGFDSALASQWIGVASAEGGFGGSATDAVYHYHSVFDSERWQEKFADPGFFRHVRRFDLILSLSSDVSLFRSRSRSTWASRSFVSRPPSSSRSTPPTTHTSSRAI